MEKAMKKFRKIWNVMHLPVIAVGTTMSILAGMLTFKRESSRKKFSIVTAATWLFQSTCAAIYNITEFFYI